MWSADGATTTSAPRKERVDTWRVCERGKGGRRRVLRPMIRALESALKTAVSRTSVGRDVAHLVERVHGGRNDGAVGRLQWVSAGSVADRGV
jgi:hypothetical protein